MDDEYGDITAARYLFIVNFMITVQKCSQDEQCISKCDNNIYYELDNYDTLFFAF